MNRPETPLIPDVQSHPDARKLPIDRVGIRNLRYPIRFVDGNDPPQSTIAVCSAYVALPADRKGTHMSRLVAAIDELAEPLSLATFPDFLDACWSGWKRRLAESTSHFRGSCARAPR